ncbi:MAG: hypothetical protein WC435_01800 [Candidatus Paceibacterota bacterium]
MTECFYKRLFYALLVFSFAFLAGLVVSLANAQTENSADGLNIEYPVSELGNCADKAECKSFCGKSENMEVCSSFAEKHGLITKEEAAVNKKFSEIKSQGGPGGCSDKASCEAFCSDLSRIDECVSFAEKNGLMDKTRLEEAKRIRQAIKNGIVPPGQCKTENECDLYCSKAENMEECLAFAEKAGFLKDKDLADAKKVLPLMKKGETPGQCKTKEECDAYCNDESHAEECADFSLKAGFMTQEEAAMFKKTKGQGPGNCKGKEECDAFCNVPENQTACFEFGKKYGMISEEQLKEMEEGKARLKEGLEKAPAEAVSCIQSIVGSENFEKIKTGEVLPPRELGEKMRECFEKNVPPGPGGCKSKEECDAFCSDSANQEACFGFAEKQGLISEEQLKEMRQSREQNGQALQNFPSEVAGCVKEKLGEETFQKIQSGSFLPNQETGTAIGECFKNFAPKSENGEIKNEQESGSNPNPAGNIPPGNKIEMMPGSENPEFKNEGGEGMGMPNYEGFNYKNIQPNYEEKSGNELRIIYPGGGTSSEGANRFEIMNQERKEMQFSPENQGQFQAPSGAGEFGMPNSGGGEMYVPPAPAPMPSVVPETPSVPAPAPSTFGGDGGASIFSIFWKLISE